MPIVKEKSDLMLTNKNQYEIKENFIATAVF